MDMVGDKSFTITAYTPNDLTPEIVVDKVLSYCTVDVDKGHKYTVDDLIAAFEEEQAEIRAYYAEVERRKVEAAEAAKHAAEEAERARIEEERRKAEEAEAAKVAAAEAASAAARAAAEAAEKEEAERLAKKTAEAAEAARPSAEATSDPMFISTQIQKIGEESVNAWLLFEIKI
eukprot:NODE_21268_length_761_cov_4.515773.p2 GENE.NODE_21268_length_761_cov_4.515773~~NODE_21268_length_761_cov_4.515773.p2  ORF type:complete len:175 (-),score=87.03 NODE_21268_length_761_cov_4.515773:128-652(-)